MIRDLLLPLTGAASADDCALEAAIAIASQRHAHLAVMHSVSMRLPTVEPWGMVPDLDGLYADLLAEARGVVDRVRPALEQAGVSHELRLAESLFLEPPAMAARHAGYADLAVIAAPVGDTTTAGAARRLFAALLLDSGRPVLVIPSGSWIEWPIVRAAVAWKPGREAARAVHDALPLLEGGAQVDVVAVDPEVGEWAHGDVPGADMAVHLARHGHHANAVALPAQDHPVAAILLRHAGAMGAQLLVAGGFGHSRAREWMLGGATRDLLHTARLPVLFSH